MIRPSRVLFLDVKLPRPDHDAASLRSAQMIAHLAGRADVDLGVISDYGFGDDAPSHAARLGARLVGVGGQESVRDHLSRSGDEYDVVLFAWSRTAAAFLPAARAAGLRAGLVYDTVDVNHIREFRHARATGNENRLKAALHVRGAEVGAVRTADCTIAISDIDRAALARLVPTARIEVVGFRFEPAKSTRRPPSAPTVLFVGHYQAAPNHDAALILAKHVMPLVRAARPDATLVLAGSEPGPEITALARDGVIVPGWEADLAHRFDAADVFAAPLRFGSGLKGKILQAMAHSVPIVASAIAAEGTGLVDEEAYLSAQDPAGCAAAILLLLDHPTRGVKMAENALGVLRERFSRDVFARQLDAVLDPFLSR